MLLFMLTIPLILAGISSHICFILPINSLPHTTTKSLLDFIPGALISSSFFFSFASAFNSSFLFLGAFYFTLFIFVFLEF
jgi:hypothetical protein